MNIKLIRSIVVSNEKLNDKFHLLTFKTGDSLFIFQSGQYLELKVDSLIYRSYSIASTPNELPYWNILVDVSPEGPGSTFLKNLKKDNVIETTSPMGLFTVKEDNADYIVIGATGCGIASIKPIVEKVLLEDNKKNISLFWGLRFERDIVFLELLKKWQNNYPNFEYKIFLSQPGEKWSGDGGHINNPLTDMVNKLPRGRTSVYLCGSSGMITEIHKELLANGFPYDRIYFESYS